MDENTKNNATKALENLQYIILIGLVTGQMIIGKWYLLGQSIYLVADIISCFRCFALERPTADKVKEIVFIAITTALIIVAIL